MGGIYIREDVGAPERFDAALSSRRWRRAVDDLGCVAIHNMASWMIDAYGSDPSATNGCQNSARWS